MERRIPLIKPKIMFVLALLLSGTGAAHEVHREVVLVVGANSPITSISSLELRKLYLGLPVSLEGVFVRPLVNHSDEMLQAIFFQSAMGMSEAAYERQLLSLTLRFGRLRPGVLHNADEVKETLKRDPRAISYTWRSDISPEDGLRIVKLLWHEQ
jgi:hypothetical protein